jgi:hypothetical protein
MAAKPLTQSSPALASSNALPRAMDLPEERAHRSRLTIELPCTRSCSACWAMRECGGRCGRFGESQEGCLAYTGVW